MSQVPRIQVPRPVVRTIDVPQIRTALPPVVRGIAPPIVDVPTAVIDYPVILLPPGEFVETPPPSDEEPEEKPIQEPVEIDANDFIPEEEDRPGLDTEEEEEEESQEEPQEESPQPESVPEPKPTPERPVLTTEQPTITIGGVEAPLPEAAPLVTAGATAVVTTSVAITSTIVLNKVKDVVLEPMMKRLEQSSQRKKKVKIKQVKPVIHYVLNDDNTVDVLEYLQKGTKVIDKTDDVERYIRDQVEEDSLYEYDNKIIIDDVIKEQFTKEGAKRFKSLFAPAKSIAKKLGSKFSI